MAGLLLEVSVSIRPVEVYVFTLAVPDTKVTVIATESVRLTEPVEAENWLTLLPGLVRR
jgi:hypothetical protein